MIKNYLKVQPLCGECKRELKEAYVKCFTCKNEYHFNPCCGLSESSYAGMSSERKAEWKCHKCRPRERRNSTNNLYQTVIYNEAMKQRRDEEDVDIETNKRIRTEIPSCNQNLDKSDTQEIKEDIKEMKVSIAQLANSMTTLNTQFQLALDGINKNLSALTQQVNDLQQQNVEKGKQLYEMDTRINKLEQQMINNNIEIGNVNNEEMLPKHIIKNIGETLGITINDKDVKSGYRIKGNKVIIEFASYNKKIDIMTKIKRHRIDATNINKDTGDEKFKFIYINDHLTFTNRKLLWLAKTKANELNWKYVWTKNGAVYARKNETSKPILIKNCADIDMISQTI